MSPQTLQLVLPVAVIAIIFLVRSRRVGKPQPLKLGLLWIRPALLLLGCAAVLLRCRQARGAMTKWAPWNQPRA